jgi:hypothetical protein
MDAIAGQDARIVIRETQAGGSQVEGGHDDNVSILGGGDRPSLTIFGAVF